MPCCRLAGPAQQGRRRPAGKEGEADRAAAIAFRGEVSVDQFLPGAGEALVEGWRGGRRQGRVEAQQGLAVGGETVEDRLRLLDKGANFLFCLVTAQADHRRQRQGHHLACQAAAHLFILLAQKLATVAGTGEQHGEVALGQRRIEALPGLEALPLAVEGMAASFDLEARQVAEQGGHLLVILITLQFLEEFLLLVGKGGQRQGEVFFLLVEKFADGQQQPLLPEEVFPLRCLGSGDVLSPQRTGDKAFRLLRGALAARRQGQRLELCGIVGALRGDIGHQAQEALPLPSQGAGSMYLTEAPFNETISRFAPVGCRVGLHRRQEVQVLEEQEERVETERLHRRGGKGQRCERVHMGNGKKNFTLVASAVLYLLFNLRLSSDPMKSLQATLWQLLQTVPYVIGIVIIIVALLQYMAGGDKLPWDRRFRLFFAVGIVVGFFYGIYEYAGAGGK
mgnify:CR=1 FL=1